MLHSPEDFEIIDAHTHPFIDPGDCIGAFGYPKTMDEFDFEMRKVGITRYAGSVISNHCKSFDEIQRVNRDALRVRDRFPGYIPGIHVDGNHPQESCVELHKMYAEGVRMVGELVPYSMNTQNYNEPGMVTVFKEVEKLGMLASLHHGMHQEVLDLVAACPDLKIMLAHPGEPWGTVDYNGKDRLKLVAAHKNLYIDISGYALFRWGMLRWAIDTCGVEKIVFGSDMPTCSVGMYLYGTLCENLTDDEFRLVLAGNFKRLIGME